LLISKSLEINGLYQLSVQKSVKICPVTANAGQRYTAHKIPHPRDLDKFGPGADANVLQSDELRRLTDKMALILDKVKYLSDRSMFGFRDIATMARDEALEFWEKWQHTGG
jgi:hypothetical protein